MTPEQRLFDFQSLAAVFNKRYAPADWKKEALNIDVMNLTPWLDRVRRAQSDLEFLEISTQYVASFRDGHSGFRISSSFRANLGISIDLYDGKPLLELVDRTRYPAADFPFQIGDELVSLGGVPVNRLLDELEAQSGWGTRRGSRRNAASLLTLRPQSVLPRATELPDETTAVFRREDGSEQSYQLKWLKSGTPFLGVGPLPNLKTAASPTRTPAATLAELREFVSKRHNWSVSAEDIALREFAVEDENGEQHSKSFAQGFGVRRPYYELPEGFVLRRGNGANDLIFTGTYEAEGKRLGLLRIPNFPSNTATMLAQLEPEITFLRANTDGLVVDVSRNNGGGCVGMDIAGRLIPNTFWFFGEQLRPTLSSITSIQQTVELRNLLGLDAETTAKFQIELDEMLAAYRQNRGMTKSIPACSFEFDNEPWKSRTTGEILAYEKPLIVLADEFSVSFGDIFPAMMQDNLRGKVVGMRTGGLGGSVSSFSAGPYGETSTSNTNSLVVRRQGIASPDLPFAPFIENIGVIPDIELDYMTKENLLNQGRPFVAGFTKILLAEIQAKQ